MAMSLYTVGIFQQCSIFTASITERVGEERENCRGCLPRVVFVHSSRFFFSTAPGQFDDCPDLRRVGINDVCTDTQVGKVIDGTLMFDTAAIFNLSTSGPCQFHQSSHMAFLYKIDMDSSSVTELFRCTYDNGINDVRKACVDNGRIKVMFNSKDNSSNNAFNFQLLLTNVQPNDSGLYRYEASFLAVETVLRKITKLFNLTDLEFSGEFIAMTWCISKCLVCE